MYRSTVPRAKRYQEVNQLLVSSKHTACGRQNKGQALPAKCSCECPVKVAAAQLWVHGRAQAPMTRQGCQLRAWQGWELSCALVDVTMLRQAAAFLSRSAAASLDHP